MIETTTQLREDGADKLDQHPPNPESPPVAAAEARAIAHLLVSSIDAIARSRLFMVSTDALLVDVAARLSDAQISVVVVCDAAGAAAGIITETDLFKVLLEMMGAREKGVRINVRVPNRAGEIAKLSQAIFNLGGNIIALGTSAGEDPSTSTLTLKVVARSAFAILNKAFPKSIARTGPNSYGREFSTPQPNPHPARPAPLQRTDIRPPCSSSASNRNRLNHALPPLFGKACHRAPDPTVDPTDKAGRSASSRAAPAAETHVIVWCTLHQLSFSTFPHKKVEDEHSEHAGVNDLDTTIYSA